MMIRGVEMMVADGKYNSLDTFGTTCVCVCRARYVCVLGMGDIDILVHDYCKVSISRLSRLLI